MAKEKQKTENCGLRRAASRLMAALIAICLLSAAGTGPSAQSLDTDGAYAPIRLSEVCCANFTLYADPETGGYEDYIELVNTGDGPANTAGYFLSDKPSKPSLFQLPSAVLEQGEMLLLAADGNGTSGEARDGVIRLSFSLKPGETLSLYAPDGTLLDSVTLAERHKNISMTKIGDTWTQAEGTPGCANEGAQLFVPATLEEPVFSLASGFYAQPKTLTIRAASGCEIRYTLDGSLPTAESELYTGPLTLRDVSSEPNRVLSHPNTTLDRSGVVEEPVPKGTLIRAAAFDGSGAHSETVTRVFYVGDFPACEGKKILSLVVDPEDLFGDMGIAVTGPAYDAWLEAGGEGTPPWPNFRHHGRTWERDAEFILWDETGQPVLESACGVRLQGDSTRESVFKRFSLFARSIYGTDSVFPVPLFGDSLSHSLCLRGGVHEVMAQSLTAGLGLGGQDAIPVTVFLNGEYYCDTFLRERYDEQYFETHFGVGRDDLIMITDDKLDIGTKADYAEYRALMDQIQSGDCSDPEFYAAICEKIDVENYAAFMATNLYLKNTDWSIYKNYKLWKTRAAGGEGVCDGRWRWLVYDMDSCFWTRKAFGDAPRASYDIFNYPAPYTQEPFIEMPVFRELLRSPDFRALFARTWLDLMNTDFSYDRTLPLLERLGLTDDPFWPDFLRDRPSYAVEMLIRDLELGTSPCSLTLAVPEAGGGEILIDGRSPELNGESWTGTYLTDMTVTLTAVPAEGWAFVGWRGADGSDQPEISLTLREGENCVTALFAPAA